MAWDLATAKTYLGITGGAQDMQIQGVLDYVLALIEVALQRKLFTATHTDTFYRVVHDQVTLSQFPVTDLTTVDGAAPGSTVVLHDKTGVVQSETFCGREDIVIEYEAGYVDLPLPLERVMWEIFLQEWGDTDGDTGGPAAGAGGSEGVARGVTIFDGFKVDLDHSNLDALTMSAGGRKSVFELWGRLAPWASVLNLYRAGNAGIGLGMA